MVGLENKRIVKSINSPDIDPSKARKIVFYNKVRGDKRGLEGIGKKRGYWETGCRGNSRTIHTDRGPDAQLRYEIYKDAGFLD